MGRVPGFPGPGGSHDKIVIHYKLFDISFFQILLQMDMGNGFPYAVDLFDENLVGNSAFGDN